MCFSFNMYCITKVVNLTIIPFITRVTHNAKNTRRARAAMLLTSFFKVIKFLFILHSQSKFLISFHRNDFIFFIWPILQKLKEDIIENTKE